MRVIVTGGLGFIGSAVVRMLIEQSEHEVLNVDVETYAATRGSVESVAENDRYDFVGIDITDADAVRRTFDSYAPDAVLHLAAESHVDRSIDGPDQFVQTNVVGTCNLLNAAVEQQRRSGTEDSFRFIHVSTDEVFGALGPESAPFNESTPYSPRSPYSASKAASDHLARAWFETYGLPTIVTNCSNNYGHFQFPEKLIPLMILNASAGKQLPVYGAGLNVRDWIHVDDHAAGLITALETGKPGETYLFGGSAERTNIDVVSTICDLVDDRLGTGDTPRRELITHVEDRPGHDLRYAIDSSKAESELGWRPSLGFEEGLASTVDWYVANEAWWKPLIEEREANVRRGRAG